MGFESLPPFYIIRRQEVEARQVARAQKHLLASSMGMSHGAVHRGGFPLTSPHSGVAWQTLPGSRTNGLFILPPWSCPLLPAPLAQIPATRLQDRKTLHRPPRVIHAISYSVPGALPSLWAASSMWTSLSG